MSSLRTCPAALPAFNPIEAPFLSREWKEGILTRPERPVNPFPSVLEDSSLEPLDSFVELFQNFHLAAASDSLTTVGTESSHEFDSGVHSTYSESIARSSPPMTPDSFADDGLSDVESISSFNFPASGAPSPPPPPPSRELASPLEAFLVDHPFPFDRNDRRDYALTNELPFPFIKDDILEHSLDHRWLTSFARGGSPFRGHFRAEEPAFHQDLSSFLAANDSSFRDRDDGYLRQFYPPPAPPSRGFPILPPPRPYSTSAVPTGHPTASHRRVRDYPARPSSAFAPSTMPSRPSGVPPRIRGSDAFEDMASFRRRCCQFCKNNGERESCYRSHPLKDDVTGLVTCPVLRKYVCDICGKTGDEAHTRRYCPENPNPSGPSVKILQTSNRNSAGKRRKAAD